jgi:mxaA protein
MNPSAMKMRTSLFALCMLALVPLTQAIAEEEMPPNVEDGIVTIQIAEPTHKVGYSVGDILEREVTLEVKKPYKLIDSSLPIVGYEKRYKGQTLGVDLSSISHTKDEGKDSTTHHIKLAYQVFTNNVVAKHASLPAEYIRLIKDSKVAQYRIPSWDFVVSPLSIFGAIKVESDMSPYRGPLLLDASQHKLRLQVLVGVIAVCLLGLLYILGKYTWLPRMGGPFAKAYRDLRKYPKNQEGLQQAVSRLHLALNTTAGQSVFSDTLDQFIAHKPKFHTVRGELDQFFQVSRQVFFEPNAAQIADPQGWLKQFCRHCRDCERGLKPDAMKSA